MTRIRGAWFAVGLILLPAAPAAAERPALEWSTWFRLGYGAEAGGDSRDGGDAGAQARSIAPPPGPGGAWEAGFGADLTLGAGDGGNLRLGAWAEARTSSPPVGGLQFVLGARPARLDMFWYQGEGALIVRAGGNREVASIAVAYGYRAPWALWGPWDGCTRYMIGVRLVASATRSLRDPDLWTASAGLEIEPVGAIRYLLGIRSWY